MTVCTFRQAGTSAVQQVNAFSELPHFCSATGSGPVSGLAAHATNPVVLLTKFMKTSPMQAAVFLLPMFVYREIQELRIILALTTSVN